MEGSIDACDSPMPRPQWPGLREWERVGMQDALFRAVAERGIRCDIHEFARI
jgi:hypothetical protein